MAHVPGSCSRDLWNGSPLPYPVVDTPFRSPRVTVVGFIPGKPPTEVFDIHLPQGIHSAKRSKGSAAKDVCNFCYMFLRLKDLRIR